MAKQHIPVDLNGFNVRNGIRVSYAVDGKLTMKYSSFTRVSMSMDENGHERKIVTSGMTSDYDDGKKTARLGLLMAMFSLVALIGFIRAY